MLIFEDCTIESPDRKVYEALGVDFPITGATVTWAGGTATIAAPAVELTEVSVVDESGEPTGETTTEVKLDAAGNPVPARKMRIDRLLHVKKPEQSADGTIAVSGSSQFLADGVSVDADDVNVTFIIKKAGWMPAEGGGGIG